MGFTQTKLGPKFALLPSRHTPRRRSSRPPSLRVTATGIPGTVEHGDGAVVVGSVDETEGQDAGSSHYCPTLVSICLI